jgi:hypothetical protein
METLRFQLLPHEPDDTFWGAPCEQPLERRYQALPALVCIMCCLFGIVYCFFGEIPRHSSPGLPTILLNSLLGPPNIFQTPHMNSYLFFPLSSHL